MTITHTFCFSDDTSSSRAGEFENVAKMSRVDDTPTVKIRTTVHNIKLPPLVQQPLVGDGLEQAHKEEKVVCASLYFHMCHDMMMCILILMDKEQV